MDPYADVSGFAAVLGLVVLVAWCWAEKYIAKTGEAEVPRKTETSLYHDNVDLR